MIKCLGKCLIYELFNAQGLDEAIKILYATLDSTFNWGHEENCKNGSLEDHMVDWLSSHQAGCGLMGEQGAESIHATFNSLARTYSGIRDPKLKLKSIMKEHYLNISPHSSTAMPPPVRRPR